MTDLTPPEHESAALVEVAVQWLVDTPRHERPGPVIPLLRTRFGLSPSQAVEVIREYNLRVARVA